jgi:hypothetical protein
MSSPEERLAALVARALQAGTLDEARTAALIALRHASDKRLVIDFRDERTKERDEEKKARRVEYEPRPAGSPKSPPAKKSPPHRPGGPPPPRQPGYRKTGRRPGPNGFSLHRARAAGFCPSCREAFAPGEVVGSYPGDGQEYHAGCNTGGVRARF